MNGETEEMKNTFKYKPSYTTQYNLYYHMKCPIKNKQEFKNVNVEQKYIKKIIEQYQISKCPAVIMMNVQCIILKRNVHYITLYKKQLYFNHI